MQFEIYFHIPYPTDLSTDTYYKSFSVLLVPKKGRTKNTLLELASV